MIQRPESPYRRFFTKDRSFSQLVRRKGEARPEEKNASKEQPPQGAEPTKSKACAE